MLLNDAIAACIVKVIVSRREPEDEVFPLYHVIEHTHSLDADNATAILEELA